MLINEMIRLVPASIAQITPGGSSFQCGIRLQTPLCFPSCWCSVRGGLGVQRVTGSGKGSPTAKRGQIPGQQGGLMSEGPLDASFSLGSPKMSALFIWWNPAALTSDDPAAVIRSCD